MECKNCKSGHIYLIGRGILCGDCTFSTVEQRKLNTSEFNDYMESSMCIHIDDLEKHEGVLEDTMIRKETKEILRQLKNAMGLEDYDRTVIYLLEAYKRGRINGE